MLKKLSFLFFIVLCGFIIFSCANIVAPTGGSRDNRPPQVVEIVPVNYTTGFSNKKIRIYFNEYVKLNNLNSKLLVSPPLSEMPEVIIKGKSIVVSLPDSLLENSTYNIFFDDAIIDITEGNAIRNFSYVFSTGLYLDSMSVKGRLIDAFTLEPVDGAYVMLYDNVLDSVPYLEKPVYVTKSNNSGIFELKSLRHKGYKIFALKDVNNNLIFDLPNEQIAFLDSLIFPVYISSSTEDTLGEDSISNLITRDSSVVDSIERNVHQNELLMFMFDNVDSTQKILSKSLQERAMVLFAFKFPMKDFHIKYLNDDFADSDFLQEFSFNKDTLKLWVKNSTVDSLHVCLYEGATALDTVKLSLRLRTGRRAIREVLNISSSISNNSKADFFSPFVLEFSGPVSSFDTSAIIFLEDSVRVFPGFVFKDSLVQRFLLLDYTFKEGSNYELIIPDSTFNDFRNLTNDSLHIKFNASTKEEYGTLKLKITLPLNSPDFIFELLDDKKNVVRRETLQSTSELKFDNLKQGKYMIRAIVDSNNNGRWDTGIYIENKQPEKVYINKSELNLRANWEIEAEWVIE
ncbi:MAG: Ig-like domain-containing protein [Bacteroidales bacterium]|nr:Ig-like domain-containing protein [Bacteroidales bacterium]